MDKIDSSTVYKFVSEEFDCRACPIATDLLRWLDDLSRANAQLETQNRRLLEIASRHGHA